MPLKISYSEMYRYNFYCNTQNSSLCGNLLEDVVNIILNKTTHIKAAKLIRKSRIKCYRQLRKVYVLSSIH